VKIGGLLKFSMIDFPGKISAIVFTQGCNINCKYCHNPELIPPAADENLSPYAEEEVLHYLEKRRGAIEGVVITGGEPAIQPDLKDFIFKIKAMGYLVKLDTNGTNPMVLKELLDAKLLDFVAMDVKASFEKYEAICRAPVNIDNIKASMRLIVNSGVPYEFRTTYDKSVLNDEDIEKLKRMIPVNYQIQECLPVKEKAVLKVGN
jgi:pyruvate formate lyase activating enzyme